MRRLRLCLIFISVLATILVLIIPGFGQGTLEELAKQRISRSTRLDPDLLATLFVTDGENQFILVFIYINERTLQSKLRPELKAAITPFLGRKAMLVLVNPTRRSFFSPALISFTQDSISHSVNPNEDVTKITEDFQAGILEGGTVSAGIVLLKNIDVNKAFQISYKEHTTNFALKL